MDKKIELIIFDMDGLMFDTEKVSYESWVRAAESFGYTIDDEVFKLTLGANLNRTKKIFLECFGMDFPIKDVIRKRAKISNQIIDEKGVPLKKGLFDLLNYLRDSDYKMAVATSTSRIRAMKLLEKANVLKYFDCIVCGDEVEKSKPDPEIFLKVLDYIPCKAEYTMVLEDSEAGVEAAFMAGMIPVMIPDIIQPTDVTKNRLFGELKDLSQVIELIRGV